MKPIITTGSTSKHPHRDGPIQPSFLLTPSIPLFVTTDVKRAPTTICSFNSSRIHLVVMPKGKGEEGPSEAEEGEGLRDTLIGESSSDIYDMIPAEKEGGMSTSDGASSWQNSSPHMSQSLVPEALQTHVALAVEAVQHSANGEVKREGALPPLLNLNLKLRRASLKPHAKGHGGRRRAGTAVDSASLEAPQPAEKQPCGSQRHTRRRPSDKGDAYQHNLMCTDAQDRLQYQMDGMEAHNLQLQQSASMARGELESLRAQVQHMQGSLQSGELENGRLQAELSCLRQSLQLDMPELPPVINSAGGVPLQNIFADFDYGEGSTSQDCMDFTDLAHDFLFRPA